MLKDSIHLTGSSYKLEEWEEMVIKQCIIDNPSFGLLEIGKLLGISERTLYRKMELYDIDSSIEYRRELLYNLKQMYNK